MDKAIRVALVAALWMIVTVDARADKWWLEDVPVLVSPIVSPVQVPAPKPVTQPTPVPCLPGAICE
jgi:hypothetical protein